MFDKLPKDPVLMLSVVNTKLRDHYRNLDMLCEDMQLDRQDLTAKLEKLDYKYDEERNQFL